MQSCRRAARRGIPSALHGNCSPNRRFGQFLSFDSREHCKSMLPGFFIFPEKHRATGVRPGRCRPLCQSQFDGDCEEFRMGIMDV